MLRAGEKKFSQLIESWMRDRKMDPTAIARDPEGADLFPLRGKADAEWTPEKAVRVWMYASRRGNRGGCAES
jgi:hypothetical protein